MTQEIENETTSAERQNIIQSYPRRWLFGSVIGILLIGGVFYHFVEGWDWIDSFYFCVMTLATIGYGDFAPRTDLGKLFTIFYVLTGLGVLATYIEVMGRDGMRRRYQRIQQRRQRPTDSFDSSENSEV